MGFLCVSRWKLSDRFGSYARQFTPGGFPPFDPSLREQIFNELLAGRRRTRLDPSAATKVLHKLSLAVCRDAHFLAFTSSPATRSKDPVSRPIKSLPLSKRTETRPFSRSSITSAI